jgi:hypothetical protein
VNPGDLEAAWAAVETPSSAGNLAGKPGPGVPPDIGAFLAVDSKNLRHLLLPASDTDEAPVRRATKGLEITIDELKVADHPARRYFDVACRDPTAHPNFTLVATDILRELAADPADTARVLDRVLALWRWFWETPAAGLADTEAVGLFGELWFLEFWLGPINAATLSCWTGPTRDRHDFKSSLASVEVKATRARTDGAASHRITTLDQLEDPETGQLHLFSLRVTPDPIGAHSLNASVDRIRNSLSKSPELLHDLDEHLAQVGYSPADRDRYDNPWRVVAEELYRVDVDFPRLTRESFFEGGVPPGVDKIGYTLDLAACIQWRIATAPGLEAQRIREQLSES